jgi:hypothetical protein
MHKVRKQQEHGRSAGRPKRESAYPAVLDLDERSLRRVAECFRPLAVRTVYEEDSYQRVDRWLQEQGVLTIRSAAGWGPRRGEVPIYDSALGCFAVLYRITDLIAQRRLEEERGRLREAVHRKRTAMKEAGRTLPPRRIPRIQKGSAETIRAELLVEFGAWWDKRRAGGARVHPSRPTVTKYSRASGMTRDLVDEFIFRKACQLGFVPGADSTPDSVAPGVDAHVLL